MTKRQLLSFAENPALLKMTVPFEGLWSGHFGHFLSRHAKCTQKETFQAPTDINSCVFSIGIILTLKPKWNFCVMSYSSVSLGLMKNCYFCFCANVCRAVTTRRQRNRRDNVKWTQSKFREKETFKLSSLVNGLKKQLGTAEKSDRKACVIMYEQSVSSVQKIG